MRTQENLWEIKMRKKMLKEMWTGNYSVFRGNSCCEFGVCQRTRHGGLIGGKGERCARANGLGTQGWGAIP